MQKNIVRKICALQRPWKAAGLALQEAAWRCWELARGWGLQLLDSDLAFTTVGAGRCAWGSSRCPWRGFTPSWLQAEGGCLALSITCRFLSGWILCFSCKKKYLIWEIFIWKLWLAGISLEGSLCSDFGQFSKKSQINASEELHRRDWSITHLKQE